MLNENDDASFEICKEMMSKTLYHKGEYGDDRSRNGYGHLFIKLLLVSQKHKQEQPLC